MLDEKLNALIQQYGIYDVIGGSAELAKPKGVLGIIKRYMQLLIGSIRLIWILNTSMAKLKNDEKAALWIGRNSFRFLWVYFLILLPKHRKKICFIIQDQKWDISKVEYHGRPVICSSEIERHPIDSVIIAILGHARHVDLLQRGFVGKIVDMDMLVHDNCLDSYFYGIVSREPYEEIFISRYYFEHTSDLNKKQIWHKKLIAYCIYGRDFLRAKKEIDTYVDFGYEDAKLYEAFWKEIETLFDDIKQRVNHRKQRDVFVYWLDEMEKKDFFSMRWVGNRENGKIFNRAYTTIVNTTRVLQSIFTGKNVKAGNLLDLKALKLRDTVFSDFLLKERRIYVFSGGFSHRLSHEMLHNSSLEFSNRSPFTFRMWYALDTILTSNEECVLFLHCMETHTFYFYGDTDAPLYGVVPDRTIFPLGQLIDYGESAKLARDYLDQELEWYYQFVPPNSFSIYMSDHGIEESLREQSVNVPFKVMGAGIVPGIEKRLFSYINLYKLINCLLREDYDMDEAFSDYVIMDILDPYDKQYGQIVREWDQYSPFMLLHASIDKDSLKKHIQTTKIVTAEGEYYTINILGEETYYRDKECKINLADDPAYLKRVAQLREKAGKFYNPWKEKREVAIDFYKYLGIKEEDIINQCY